MLHSIKFLENYLELFVKNEIISFRNGVNLIVGDQGTGKSTLLNIIRYKNPIIDITADLITSFSLDFEKDNPRITDLRDDDGKGAYFSKVASRFVSHGQIVNKLLEKLDEESKCLFILDEPDSALSIRSCVKLVQTLKEAEKRNCQIIAAVHNPIVITAFTEVFSMEHKKWINSADFINSQYTSE